MGERYRREMLAHGGAKEPMLMVEGNFALSGQVLNKSFHIQVIKVNGKLYFLPVNCIMFILDHT